MEMKNSHILEIMIIKETQLYINFQITFINFCEI